MVAFLLAVGVDSAECMSTYMFYNLTQLGHRQGDTVALEFVARPEDALRMFLNNAQLDVLMYQSGELCLSPAAMLDYMYKPQSPMTIVHPLGHIAWEKVAAGVSMGSPLPAHILGLDYNVPIASAEASDDPDIILVRNCTLTNFKVNRATAEMMAKGSLDVPVSAYIKETASITDRRPHTGCIGERCFQGNQMAQPQAAG